MEFNSPGSVYLVPGIFIFSSKRDDLNDQSVVFFFVFVVCLKKRKKKTTSISNNYSNQLNVVYRKIENIFLNFLPRHKSELIRNALAGMK